MEEKKIKKVIVVFEDEAPFIYEVMGTDCDCDAAKTIHLALRSAQIEKGFTGIVLAYSTPTSIGNGACGDTQDCLDTIVQALVDLCFSSGNPAVALDIIEKSTKKLFAQKLLSKACDITVIDLSSKREPSQK
ncbi:hypothetical protein [uncultured Cloacibacillus sp.]|uniref:hypothetical protein n=1 Tax=uncultured Cloacibacillus sp. TaxID=889794 RepID=UPI002589EE86|nr:hypothetical protein [uncultured Cloacibacillus sp.]